MTRQDLSAQRKDEIAKYRAMLADGPANLDRDIVRRKGLPPALAIMLAFQIAASTLAWLILAVCALAALVKIAGWL
ncbi:hypothetical protein [Roseicyclus sp.]|uniref:hypothetical protein n=1 Tax=Roseicyclus sp. TaxID=1914329 RepID=UPI003F6AC7FC